MPVQVMLVGEMRVSVKQRRVAMRMTVGLADRVPRIAVTAAYTRIVVIAVTEMRDINAADGNADVLSPLASQKLATRQKLAQILADFSLDDPPKPLVILVDL